MVVCVLHLYLHRKLCVFVVSLACLVVAFCLAHRMGVRLKKML